MSNPYQATASSIGRTRHLHVATAAFLSVLSVAALCSLIAPAVAYFIASLPADMYLAILGISLSTCIPFGLAAGFIAARFAARKTGVLSVLMLLSVYFVIVPLAYLPQTAGPILDYTALAFGFTIFAALFIGIVLRRWV